MVSAPNNNSLSSNQDTSRFLVEAGIEPQISYSTIGDFTSWANRNSLWGQLSSYILVANKLVPIIFNLQ